MTINKKMTSYCPNEYKQEHLKTYTPWAGHSAPRYLPYKWHFTGRPSKGGRSTPRDRNKLMSSIKWKNQDTELQVQCNVLPFLRIFQGEQYRPILYLQKIYREKHLRKCLRNEEQWWCLLRQTRVKGKRNPPVTFMWLESQMHQLFNFLNLPFLKI